MTSGIHRTVEIPVTRIDASVNRRGKSGHITAVEKSARRSVAIVMIVIRAAVAIIISSAAPAVVPEIVSPAPEFGENSCVCLTCGNY